MKIIYKDTEVNRIVFHYNKAHNQDPTIPTWIVKHKGQTYYVNHMESKVGFSTKETPDNQHTKGSIQFRGILSIIQNENNQMEAVIE
jgi:hypothetical protein